MIAVVGSVLTDVSLTGALLHRKIIHTDVILNSNSNVWYYFMCHMASEGGMSRGIICTSALSSFGSGAVMLLGQ